MRGNCLFYQPVSILNFRDCGLDIGEYRSDYKEEKRIQKEIFYNLKNDAGYRQIE
jgi:hypothetical protein